MSAIVVSAKVAEARGASTGTKAKSLTRLLAGAHFTAEGAKGLESVNVCAVNTIQKKMQIWLLKKLEPCMQLRFYGSTKINFVMESEQIF